MDLVADMLLMVAAGVSLFFLGLALVEGIQWFLTPLGDNYQSPQVRENERREP